MQPLVILCIIGLIRSRLTRPGCPPPQTRSLLPLSWPCPRRPPWRCHPCARQAGRQRGVGTQEQGEKGGAACLLVSVPFFWGGGGAQRASNHCCPARSAADQHPGRHAKAGRVDCQPRATGRGPGPAQLPPAAPRAARQLGTRGARQALLGRRPAAEPHSVAPSEHCSESPHRVSSTFADLMSRWTMRRECRYTTARATSSAICRATGQQAAALAMRAGDGMGTARAT